MKLFLLTLIFFRITLRGDDIQDLRWHEVLLSTKEVPSDDILECLCKMPIRKSDQVSSVLAMHGPEINQILRHMKTVVKRHIDRKNRARNFEARMNELK